MSIFTFFQQLFAQPITQKQIFAEDISKINSLEKAIQQSELVVNYLLQEHYTPSMSICVTKRGFPIWEQGYGLHFIVHLRLGKWLSVFTDSQMVHHCFYHNNRPINDNSEVYRPQAHQVRTYPKEVHHS